MLRSPRAERARQIRLEGNQTPPPHRLSQAALVTLFDFRQRVQT